MRKHENGNAVVIILITVALFAGLTFTLSNSTRDGGETSGLSVAQAELHATQIMTYAAEAESVIDQMVFNGTFIEAIDEILPSDAAFETGSDIDKLFHPDGGGLTYKTATEPPFVMVSPAPTTQSSWVLSDITNVEWSDTTASDIILTAFGIAQPVCQAINNAITGATTIPVLGAGDAGYPDDAFAEDSGGADLLIAECAECEGQNALCVSNSSADRWYYYSVIGAQ